MMDKYKVTLNELQNDHAVLLDKQTALLEELELVTDRLAETDRDIKQIEETMLSVSRLCGVELATLRLLSPRELGRLGLTAAIREVMKSATGFITAVDVRNRMLDNKFDDAKYDNLLASVHVTLKRLAKSGELLKDEFDGKTAYKTNPGFIPTIERMSPPALP
jgi:hypothetical protein